MGGAVCQGAGIRVDEAVAFCRRIESALAEKDIKPFCDAFDDAALVRTAAGELGAGADQVRELSLNMAVGKGIANRILKSVQQGGSYRLVRVDAPAEGVLSPSFRLLAEGSINYHRWKLARDGQGNIKIADIEILLMGESLGRTLKRMLPPLIDPSRTGRFKDYAAQLDEVAAMQRVAAGGDYSLALYLWEKLPESLRAEKAIFLYRMEYAQNAGSDEWKRASAEFEKRFPGDPALDLIRMNQAAGQKDFAAALQAVDRLDQVVKDPYLDVFRGQFFASQKDMDKAQLAFERVVKWDATVERGWGGLIVLSLAKKDFDRTVTLLEQRQAATHKPIPLSVINTSPQFAEFAASPQGARWKASHPEKPK